MRRNFTPHIALYENGLCIVEEFLAANPRLGKPVFNSVRGTIHSTGLYESYGNGRVYVNLEETTLPVQKPSHMRWSWPGWKTDRTATGVIAHETGHFVSDRLRVSGGWSRLMRTAPDKRITSYEPLL